MYIKAALVFCALIANNKIFIKFTYIYVTTVTTDKTGLLFVLMSDVTSECPLVPRSACDAVLTTLLNSLTGLF